MVGGMLEFHDIVRNFNIVFSNELLTTLYHEHLSKNGRQLYITIKADIKHLLNNMVRIIICFVFNTGCFQTSNECYILGKGKTIFTKKRVVL